jgi:hypothetical protein
LNAPSHFFGDEFSIFNQHDLGELCRRNVESLHEIKLNRAKFTGDDALLLFAQGIAVAHISKIIMRRNIREAVGQWQSRQNPGANSQEPHLCEAGAMRRLEIFKKLANIFGIM